MPRLQRIQSVFRLDPCQHDLLCQFHVVQVPAQLEKRPEIWRHPEETGQRKAVLDVDASFSVHDFVDTLIW